MSLQTAVKVYSLGWACEESSNLTGRDPAFPGSSRLQGLQRSFPVVGAVQAQVFLQTHRVPHRLKRKARIPPYCSGGSSPTYWGHFHASDLTTLAQPLEVMKRPSAAQSSPSAVALAYVCFSLHAQTLSEHRPTSAVKA